MTAKGYSHVYPIGLFISTLPVLIMLVLNRGDRQTDRLTKTERDRERQIDIDRKEKKKKMTEEREMEQKEENLWCHLPQQHPLMLPVP